MCAAHLILPDTDAHQQDALEQLSKLTSLELEAVSIPPDDSVVENLQFVSSLKVRECLGGLALVCPRARMHVQACLLLLIV